MPALPTGPLSAEPYAAGVATLADLHRLMNDLPEVAEGEYHGQVTWSVRGNRIARVRPFSKADIKRFGDQPVPVAPILAVDTSDLHEKEGVLAAGLTGVFTIPHLDNYPVVLVEIAVVGLHDLRDLLVSAWLAVAPAELADRFDGFDG